MITVQAVWPCKSQYLILSIDISPEADYRTGEGRLMMADNICVAELIPNMGSA